jgi:hypothetical protein
MRMRLGTDLQLRSRKERVSVAGSALFASERRIPRSSATPLLRIQQSPADRVQIGERGGAFQAVQALGQAPVADLLEAEHPLDHPDRVLDLRPHARLGAVRGLDRLVDPAAPSIALVGKVPRARRHRAHRVLLSSIRLVAPDPSLVAMQQVRQRERIGDVRSRRQDRVDQLRLAVDANVGLHPKVPLVALRHLMHLRVALAILVLGRTRCTDDRRVHDRAVRDLDAVAPQMLVDRLQQRLAQLVALQQMPELAHRRLVRCAFDPEIDTDEPAHRHRVVERFLNRRVRQVEPQLQEVDPQHPLQRNRWPPPVSLIFGYTFCTAAVISGHGMIRSISARNCAQRVVLPYFSKPVSVCCSIDQLA